MSSDFKIIPQGQILQIVNAFSSYQEEAEAEIRFGSFVRGSYQPGVSRRTFDRVAKIFSGLAPIQTVQDDFILPGPRVPGGGLSSSNRHSVFSSGEEEWTRKTPISTFTSDLLPIRVSTSREQKIDPISDFPYTIVRKKNRSSYYLYSRQFRLDLTSVQTIQQRKRDGEQIRYEIELEVLTPQFSHDSLQSACFLILNALLNSEYVPEEITRKSSLSLYTESMKRSVLSFVASVLGGRQGTGIDPASLMQSRNLKLRDLVWGGLVGNPSTSYSVTHKADGVRKLLVFHQTGIWFVSPPEDVILVSPPSKQFEKLNGTILDGELVPRKNRLAGAPTSTYWYLTFDCLSYTGMTSSPRPFDRGVQDQTLVQRMQTCQTVKNLIPEGDLLTIHTKEFKNFTGAEKFFQIMREMFAQQPSLPYRQDGFIFSPNNVPYNPGSDKFPLHERILTQIPDNCKWKPREELTIDFALSWKTSPGRPNTLELLTSDRRDSGERVNSVFRGSRRFPFSGRIDSDNPLLAGLESGTVVEFRMDFNSGEGVLVPTRIRYDKPWPNRREIALDVWQDIHSPLTRETMEGDTLDLVRRYHNRIKSELLSSLPEGSTLLDLGSGRGGDVDKWRHLSQVIAIEPSGENLAELRNRLTNSDIRNVAILQAGAEDTARVSEFVSSTLGGRKVDAVSMMLSMSFFWQSPQFLSQVIETIDRNLRPGGIILFLTVDGDCVQQTFTPFNGLALERLDFGKNSLIYNSASEQNPYPTLTVDLPGTIVEKQTEPLVHLADLMQRFSLTVSRADKEKFLTPDERIFTNLYSYGTGRRRGEISTLLDQSPERVLLQALPVSTQISGEKASGDDTFSPLTSTWFSNLVRVACLDFGSSFFHVLLKAFYPLYNQNGSSKLRTELVSMTRRDLSLISPTHMSRLLNSSSEVDAEVFRFVSETIGIDIVIFDATSSDLLPVLSTAEEGSSRRLIVMCQVQTQLELIALDNGANFQTLFEPSDPFAIASLNFFNS